jgi:fatty-acyl-CoA synthase
VTVAARTVGALLLELAEEHRPGLLFEDHEMSWAEHVRASADLAAVLRTLRVPGRPFHIGMLAENIPEFSILLGAAALSGAVVVGINPTRRGAALARDIRSTDCQLVITEPGCADLLDGTDVDVLVTGGPRWRNLLAQHRNSAVRPLGTAPDDLFMLIFTSGTSGEPKAVRCTHEKITAPARMLAGRFELSTSDTVYVSMPLFHSNAMIAGWGVAVAAGATLALRRRFSASEFLPDIRKFGACYANYVGKPLSYVLSTTPKPDDADNPLRLMYGNEGTGADIAEFARRFDVTVVDGFGSTEGGIAISRTQDSPPGALGPLPVNVALVDITTGKPCPPAEFDAAGRVVNGAECIGELVNIEGSGAFAGYYGDEGADRERMRGGVYHSGDLGFLDRAGYCYYAGRTGDWLRVGGENLGAAPIEEVLRRHPAVRQVAVYGVPDRGSGDRVMAALVGDRDRLGSFTDFLAAQGDLGKRQWPVFLRLCTDLPRTATFKTRKRDLAAQRWNCTDPVWWLPPGATKFRPLSADGIAALESEIAVVSTIP